MAGVVGLALLAVAVPSEGAPLDMEESVLPVPVEHAAAAWADGSFYVFGGRPGSGAPLATIHTYDPWTDGLSLVGELPWGLSDAAAVSDGAGHVYLFGGRTGATFTDRSDAVLRFDAADGSVTVMAASLPSADAGLAAVWADGQALVFPGIGCLTGCSVVRYDPLKDAFQQGPAMPERTWRAGAFWNGTHAFLLGGKEPATGAPKDTIDRYDPATGVYERLEARLPAPRAEGPVLWDGQVAYLPGGESADGDVADVLVFHPGTGAAGVSPRPLPAPASGIAGAWGPTGFLFAANGPSGKGVQTLCFDCGPPVAAFACTADTALGVRFEDLSHPSGLRPLAAASWDLGDGSSQAAAVEHVYAEPGPYPVRLTVTDTAGRSDVLQQTCEARLDGPPALAPLGTLRTTECGVLRFRLQGSDPEEAPLAYSMEPGILPPQASLDGDTFTWAPGEGSAGAYGPVAFTVSDGTHTANETATFEVAPCAAPPTSSPPPPTAGPAPVEGPTPEGPPGDVPVCPVLPVPWPMDVTARVEDGVEVAWRFAEDCAVDRFLVWNGTGDTLVAVVPAEAGRTQYAARDQDPWSEPHRYWVQAQPAGLPDAFDAMRATASGLVFLPCACDEEEAPVGVLVEAAARTTQPLLPATAVVLGLAAVAMGATLAHMASRWRRALGGLGAVGLFTRLRRDQLLDHESRAKIVELVAQKPGIHYNEVVRALGTGNGAAEHHLKVLLAGQLIRERTTDGYRCFFPAEYADPRMMDATITLRAGLAQEIVAALVEQPGSTIGQLAEVTGAPARTVSYHLQRFRRVGLVEVRRQGRAYAVYPSGIANTLVARGDLAEAAPAEP